MNRLRWLSIVVAVAVLMVGPLGPSAWAQQSQPPKLYGEVVKAPERPAPTASTAYGVGAVGVNLIRVPGKTVLCALGGVAGLVTLAITFGSGYRAAAKVVEEGCGGPWVLSAKDLQEDRLDLGMAY